MKPILSYAKSHYFRSHVRVLGKVTAADETIAQIGFVMQCPKCLRTTSYNVCYTQLLRA